MRYVVPEMLFIATTITVGWAALWPLARQLGPTGYFILGFPIGLLSWSMIAVASTMLGTSFSALSAAAGVIGFILLMWALAMLVGPGTLAAQVGPFPLGRHLASTAGLLAVAFALALSRLTVAAGDGWTHYWPLGVWLAREGSITADMLSSRSVPVASIGAATAMFGGEWTYVAYPMMGLCIIGVLFMMWLKDIESTEDRIYRRFVGIVLLALLALSPTWVFHSFFLHTHVISTMFLLVSLASLRMACPGNTPGGPLAPSWLIVSGVSAAGLALSRPDGLAYVFIPIAIAVSVLTMDDRQSRSVAAFFAPLITLVGAVYLTGYWHLGMWEASKLSGMTAAAILCLIGSASLLPYAIRRFSTLHANRLTGAGFAGFAVLAGLIGLIGTIALRHETALLALAHVRINLFGGAGGWGYLWWLFVPLLLLTVLTGDATRKSSWTRLLFLAISMFFIIAGLVHGNGHTGRIGAGDSFNRVAFHIVPVIVWYFGLVWARMRSDARPLVDLAGRATSETCPADTYSRPE